MAATDATKFLNKTEYEIALSRMRSYIDGVTPTKLSELTDDIVTGHYLPLAGGTLTGQLTLPGSASAPDTNVGLNLVYNSTNKGHIGQSTLLGIYSTGDIVIRPNGASSSAAGNGSLEITSSGITAREKITAEGFIKSGGTSSQFLKADGSVDSNSYLKTTGGTVSGNITATNFIKSGSSNSDVLLGGGGIKALSKFITLDKPYQMPTNAFGGASTSIHQNLTNDGMYAASHRFNVTLTGMTGNKNNLFDGNYETYCIVAAGGTGTILIESDTALFGTFTYGYTFISFYYTFIPESVSMRFYGTRSGTVGWYDANPATFYYGSSSATSNIAYSIYNSNTYNVSKIEITIKAKSDKASYITQVDHMFTRGATIYMSAVTKFPVKQDLWGPVEINNTLSVTDNITTSGHVAVGTGRSNGSYIGSDSATNIYLHNSAGYPLVADGLVVRRGAEAASTTLGSTQYRWGGVYSTIGNFSDALTLSGTTAATRRIYFGDTSHYLELDSTGFHFSHGVYSDSFISAGGASDSSGSGGIGIEDITTRQDGTVVFSLSDGNSYTIDLNHEHPQYPRYVLLADEAAYEALATKEADTLYLIPETSA